MDNTKKPTVKKFKGFTLVELIVVITILAILGTIGFLSIGGYSSRARDSTRIGDIAQVSKSLDLSMVVSSSYPVPDNSFAVTHSGGTVWNQGTVGANVMQYFKGTIAGGGINKKPVDPLKNTEYAYSSLAEGKAYQIKAEYEGELNQAAYEDNPLLNSAFAGAGDPTIAYVRGNFGGLTAKTTTGGIVYVIAVPSIITNSGTTAGNTVTTASLSGTLLFNGKSLRNASFFNPSTVVYSGAKVPSNPSGLPDTGTGIYNMMVALKSIYGASDIQGNQSIATLINTATGSLAAFGTSIISAQLGGSSGGGGGTPTVLSSGCSGIVQESHKFSDNVYGCRLTYRPTKISDLTAHCAAGAVLSRPGAGTKTHIENVGLTTFTNFIGLNSRNVIWLGGFSRMSGTWSDLVQEVFVGNGGNYNWTNGGINQGGSRGTYLRGSSAGSCNGATNWQQHWNATMSSLPSESVTNYSVDCDNGIENQAGSVDYSLMRVFVTCVNP